MWPARAVVSLGEQGEVGRRPWASNFVAIRLPAGNDLPPTSPGVAQFDQQPLARTFGCADSGTSILCCRRPCRAGRSLLKMAGMR